MKLKVAIASDHAGYNLKQFIKDSFDLDWVDLSAKNDKDSVDYPDFGYAVAECVANDEAEFGIAVCGTGIGISIAANRSPKVRAAVCHNAETARLGRAHNNANVMALGGRVVDEVTAIACLHKFLETDFEAGGRHERRVGMLS